MSQWNELFKYGCLVILRMIYCTFLYLPRSTIAHHEKWLHQKEYFAKSQRHDLIGWKNLFS